VRQTDEQLNCILQRTEILKRRNRRRKEAAQSASLLCVFLCAVAALPALLPELPQTAGTAPGGAFGSLISSGPYLRYAVVGIISFILGITVTILCMLIHRRNDR